MVANQHFSRIDTLKLRALFYQKLGHQTADKYFNLLQLLFSSKISKNEFDKFCVRAIGRDHIPLHNRLIRSLLKNTCLSQVPPPKVRRVKGSLNVKIADGYPKSYLQSLYGDTFPPSPRKGRRSPRDRKYRGPPGKTQSPTCEESLPRVQEQQSATELHSLGSRPPLEVASVEEGEEVEQTAGSPCVQSRSPVTAPLGISMNIGGVARKTLLNGSAYNFHPETCQNSGELPDTRSLRSRLEKKLEMEGLSISVDSVNLLNNGLDAFLKRLVEPCMGLTRSRHGKEHVGGQNGQFARGLNGILPGRCTQRPIQSTCASILDFRVSMESNPYILGEDWAVQLEKICSRAYEE